MINLKFDCMGAQIAGVAGHAQTVMRDLGIAYQISTPQSLYDSWWFWNCQNVPEVLPEYISSLKCEPQKAVGYGLSQAEADSLSPAPTGDNKE